MTKTTMLETFSFFFPNQTFLSSSLILSNLSSFFFLAKKNHYSRIRGLEWEEKTAKSMSMQERRCWEEAAGEEGDECRRKTKQS